MAQNFTDAVTGALQQAFSEAQQENKTEVTENQLLKSFLEEPQGYFAAAFSSLGANPSTLSREVEQNLSRLPTFGSPQAPAAARNLQNRIADAQSIAKKMGDSYTSSDHFLLSYWKNGGEPFAHWKQSSGISLKQLEDYIKKIRGDRHMDSPTAESSLQTLEKYLQKPH